MTSGISATNIGVVAVKKGIAPRASVHDATDKTIFATNGRVVGMSTGVFITNIPVPLTSTPFVATSSLHSVAKRRVAEGGALDPLVPETGLRCEKVPCRAHLVDGANPDLGADNRIADLKNS